MSAFVVTSTYLLNSCRTNPFHSSETFLIHVNRGGIVGLGVNVVFIIDRAYIYLYILALIVKQYSIKSNNVMKIFAWLLLVVARCFVIPKLSWSTKMALTSTGDMTP